MGNRPRCLVVQTAFLGDLILTLPLVQALHALRPEFEIDLVARADAASVTDNHPALSTVFRYDKRGGDSGVSGFLDLRRNLRERTYEFVLAPHRSLRTAFLAGMTGIPVRVSFDRSAGRMLFNRIVPYDPAVHEYRRNLNLLAGLGLSWPGIEYPKVFPSEVDVQVVDSHFASLSGSGRGCVAIAPGTLWNTKRWLRERFVEVAQWLRSAGYHAVLIGGPADADLCSAISEASGPGVYSLAGILTPLQSAEAIRRCKLLLTNDSAPLHLGVAVGTPVAAIFGATTPSIGFSPYGPSDIVIENPALNCRPCAIHGGDSCPIGTFECMKSITAARVTAELGEILARRFV